MTRPSGRPAAGGRRESNQIDYSFIPEGTALPYVPSAVLGCVVFLGYQNELGQDKFAGSAFWVSRPGHDEITPKTRFGYLVTAAHVIQEVEAKVALHDQRVRVRMNTKQGGQNWYDTPLSCWRTHPDPAVDVAVFKMDLDATKWDHTGWPTEAFVHGKSAEDDGGRAIGHGDDLFVAGLFYLRAGDERNIPILRMANVAALRGEPVENRDGRFMDAYLVESRSIGGLSGSPVFYDVYAAKEAFLGESRFLRTQVKFRLLGVMHGHFNLPDAAPDMVVEDRKERVEINTGIAIVTPAEKIVEVLDMFADEEAEGAEKHHKKLRSHVVPDSVRHDK